MEEKEFIVHDRVGPVILRGFLLSDRRFGSERKPRWTDMALYRLTRTERDYSRTVRSGGPDQPLFLEPQRNERSFRYALEIVARSWVYHDTDSPCVKERHTISSVAEVRASAGRWRNLLPCEKCKPAEPEDMRDDQFIAEETPDPHLYLCLDVQSILRRIYRHSGEISVLAAKLLADAALADPAIAAALKTKRKI